MAHHPRHSQAIGKHSHSQFVTRWHKGDKQCYLSKNSKNMNMIFQEFSIKRKCIFQETWSVGPNVVLSDFNLEVTSGGSPELIVGSGLVGCVREGPGVRFTRNDTSLVNSQHVRWGLGDNCLLPNTCSGKTNYLKFILWNYFHLFQMIPFKTLLRSLDQYEVSKSCIS